MNQSPTVAEKLIELFSHNDLNTMYGVIGDAVFPFFAALSKQNDIQFYGTSHEVNAAFMASYYAKLTNEVGICVATSGPGAANLINGLADAYFDKAPVLAITGQVATKKVGTNAKQYINQQQLLQAVTKSSKLVTTADNVIPAVAKALNRAAEEKTVTHISLPVDLFSQSISKPVIPQVKSKSTNQAGSKGDNQLADIIELLNSVQKPLIVVGKGDKNQRKTILELTDKLGAGIIVAQQAKGVIPDSHSHVLGGIGEAFTPGLLNETDCILLLGSASYEMKYLPNNVKLVQIVDEATNLNYKVADKTAVGKIETILKSLTEKTEAKQNRQWINKIEQEKENLNNMVNEQASNTSTPIQPAYLMTVLNEVLAKDAIIVCDVGGFIHWFDTYFQTEEQNILISSHWRSMGGGLPGALSASIAQPEKQIVALVGDGGLLMSLGEIATAVKYQLPITVIVANNHQYELEKLKMQFQSLQPFGYDINVPDFAALAKSFGAKGKSVKEPQQLRSVLAESLSIQEPVIVDVDLDSVSLPAIK